jgi:hypothetical protein
MENGKIGKYLLPDVFENMQVVNYVIYLPSGLAMQLVVRILLLNNAYNVERMA